MTNSKKDKKETLDPIGELRVWFDKEDNVYYGEALKYKGLTSHGETYGEVVQKILELIPAYLTIQIDILRTENASMKEIIKDVEGLCLGVDWNKGTHAKIYRPKVEKAIKKLTEAGRKIE